MGGANEMMDMEDCRAPHTPGIRLCNYLCLSILCDVLRQQQSAPLWSSGCNRLPVYFAWKGKRLTLPYGLVSCVFGMVLQNLCGRALWKQKNELVVPS